MRVKLGDIVDKIVGDEDRLTTKLNYYIGGEHIESSRIKVRNRGLLNDEKRQTLGYQFHYPFEPGDVLFMTKNPYLKKCSQVDFHGICSIATFVLRTKDTSILSQDYLAVVTQTDDFWNYLEANKSGSVNYFITWKTLEAYEFELPILEKQKSIAEIIFAAEELRSRYEKQIELTDELVKAQFIEFFGDPLVNPKKWVTKSLLEMGYCKNGMNYRSGDTGIEIHCLGVGDFKDLSIINGTDHLPTISLNETPPEESLLRDGDIVFVRSNGNKELVGRCLIVYPHEIPTTYSGFCIRYRLTSNEVCAPYLLRVLKMDSMRKKMAGRGANIQNLNQKILSTLDIPIPPIEMQEQFATFVEQADISKHELKQACSNLQEMTRSLLNNYE